jgi:hypothetical protein
MLLLAGIATQRRSPGEASDMRGEIEPMHGGIAWAVLVPQLFLSFLDVFVRFALIAGQLKPDTLSRNILDRCGQFRWRIAILVLSGMLITQTWGIGARPIWPAKLSQEMNYRLIESQEGK